MIGSTIAWFLCGAAGLLGFTRFGYLYSRLPAIWRGSPDLPLIRSQTLVVRPRSYLTFVLCATALWAGFVLAAIGVATKVPAFCTAGLLFGLSLAPLTLLHWQINVAVRPRLLVPPSRRGETGSWAEARAEEERRRAAMDPVTRSGYAEPV